MTLTRADLRAALESSPGEISAQNIIDLLDEADAAAQRVGALESELRDWQPAIADNGTLRHALDAAQAQVAHMRAVAQDASNALTHAPPGKFCDAALDMLTTILGDPRTAAAASAYRAKVRDEAIRACKAIITNGEWIDDAAGTIEGKIGRALDALASAPPAEDGK